MTKHQDHPTPPLTPAEAAYQQFVRTVCGEYATKVVQQTQTIYVTLGAVPPDMAGIQAGAEAATALVLGDLALIMERFMALQSEFTS